MLKPVTMNYKDKSTMEKFEFVFHCDCCGFELSTTVYKYDDKFPKKLFMSNSEREARQIMYASEHEKAYERANNEVIKKLSKCSVCGEMVCDSCVVISSEDGREICKRCYSNGIRNKTQIRGEGGRKKL